ncbi:hypothetical protein [Alicyclobacillus macrosporangiidus]|nr:hypothetical protein [Alicyclobacillus macrosporangiidus]
MDAGLHATPHHELLGHMPEMRWIQRAYSCTGLPKGSQNQPVRP